MGIDYGEFISLNSQGVKASEIRELLKLTAKPDIISFAGGLPDPNLFPISEIQAIIDQILKTHAASALQYGKTEGVDELREELVAYMGKEGIQLKKEQLIIITASQQGLDLITRLFIDP